MKHVTTVFQVALLASMFIVLAGTDKINCSPVPPEEPVCAAPSDCEGLPHAECVGAWACEDGACLWECKVVEPGCCAADSDCPAGSVCVGDACEAAPGPGECWGDADCEDGAKCVGAITCPCKSMCFAASAPGTCQQPPMQEGCYTDADCADGQSCQITNDCCSPPGCTDPAQPCPDVCVPCGACVPVTSECQTDADCEEGDECQIETYCPPCTEYDPPCLAPCQAVGKCIPAPTQACTIVDPAAFGACEMLLGIGYTGEDCVYVSGCGCKDSCDALFETMEECKVACAPAPGRIPSACKTLDQTAYGQCKMLLGYGLIGQECAPIGGCDCGKDCDHIFPTIGECEKKCLPPKDRSAPPRR